MLNDFITALQFLSRIRLWPQKSWDEEGFSRSVKWFPLVGLLIGLGDGLVWWLCSPIFSGLPLALLLLLSHFFWAGALCYDGLMDTADGVFSGRPRERMLEIMKDSHVGAFGVLAGVVALLVRVVFVSVLSGELLLAGLIAAPILSRWLMIVGITVFPYARPEGLGKAFVRYSGKGSLVFGTLLMGALLTGIAALVDIRASWLFPITVLWGVLLSLWLKGKLGGLTGDCYGAIAETSELAMWVALAAWYLR
jgi:cobalamin 5''-phosphate synthase/cobalamin synthase